MPRSTSVSPRSLCSRASRTQEGEGAMFIYTYLQTIKTMYFERNINMSNTNIRIFPPSNYRRSSVVPAIPHVYYGSYQ